MIPKVFTGGVPTYDKKGSKRETRADKLREELKKKEEEKLKVYRTIEYVLLLYYRMCSL